MAEGGEGERGRRKAERKEEKQWLRQEGPGGQREERRDITVAEGGEDEGGEEGRGRREEYLTGRKWSEEVVEGG